MKHLFRRAARMPLNPLSFPLLLLSLLPRRPTPPMSKDLSRVRHRGSAVASLTGVEAAAFLAEGRSPATLPAASTVSTIFSRARGGPRLLVPRCRTLDEVT